MTDRPIKTEAEYEAACKEIDKFFDHEPELGTPDGDRFELLSLLIDAYEREHFPIEAPDPVEAIKFRMEMAGYSQADLARLIGSASRASEILNRKRHLTVDAIWTLTREWKIPAESLIKPYAIQLGKKAVRVSMRHKARKAARKTSLRPTAKRARV